MEYYKVLQQHYEKRLREFGPNHRGMDWPNAEDLAKRFTVLTDVMQPGEQTVKLLDLGCGVGLLLDHLEAIGRLGAVDYYGVDISEKMIEAGRRARPAHRFEVRDVLQQPFADRSFDYVIMNGLLTEKQSMSQQQMIEFAKNIILNTYKSCTKGIAFNVMSTHVDWKRDDLFHWELDDAVGFMVKNCSRRIRISMNYDLYEYTVYLYK